MDIYCKLLNNRRRLKIEVGRWVILLSAISYLQSSPAQTGTINVDENHNGHKIFGLPTPTAGNEAATKAYADSVGGGGGGAAAWGSITGTLSAQTDLQTALDNKQPIDADLTAIAALSGTHNIYYRSASNTWSTVTIGSGLDFTGATLSATGGSTVTPAALTKTDDTNVTLTLGGTPATALLQATSLTLGWSGTLAVSRGGTGAATATAHNYFGNNTGSGAAPGFHQIDFSELAGNWTLAQGPSTTASKLLGRTDASAGIPQEITLGTNLAISGTTLNATGGTTSFANPTAKVGASVVNGSATTAMRSDAAPPINQTVDLGMTAAQTVVATDTGTISVVDVLAIEHSTNGTPAANYGTALLFRAKDNGATGNDAGRVAVVWGDATHATHRSAMDFQLDFNGGSPASGMTLYQQSGGGALSVGSQTNPAAVGIINASSGYWVANAASTTGKILQSDGSKFTASTPTWPALAGAAGYTPRSDGTTGFASYPAQLVNSSVSAQSPSTSDVYLAGSNIVVTAGDFKAKGQYKCVFDMTKSAGTGAIVITLRVGVNGSTADAAIQTYTFGAGTSVADTGIFEVIATWRTVGSGTSAVMQGICRGTHLLATTGLFNNAAGWVLIGSPSPSSGFASNTATNIGISFNGSTAFAGTAQVVQAQLQQ
jgi:hypothetical protein